MKVLCREWPVLPVAQVTPGAHAKIGRAGDPGKLLGPLKSYLDTCLSWMLPGARTRLQNDSMFVVDNGLVEFALSSLDMLLDGEGLAVFGQRDCARAG